MVDEALVRDHYQQEAEQQGALATSTMRDETTRQREVSGILATLDWLDRNGKRPKTLVDVGCGNAYLLATLRNARPDLDLTGIEYTPELADIARARHLSRCRIIDGDARALPLDDGSVDVAVTERCLINLMDTADQETALSEIARALRPGGHFICIEAFTDGLEELNHARAEVGLPPNAPPHHNLWLDKRWFLSRAGAAFDRLDDPALPPPNFLSSHYYMSRAVYPAVTRAEVVYNSHFARFFSFLPPIGNYSPIQFFVLRKRAGQA